MSQPPAALFRFPCEHCGRALAVFADPCADTRALVVRASRTCLCRLPTATLLGLLLTQGEALREAARRLARLRRENGTQEKEAAPRLAYPLAKSVQRDVQRLLAFRLDALDALEGRDA